MRVASSRAVPALCLMLWLAGCSGNGAPPEPPPPPPEPPPPEPTYQAEIRRTEYGIPHIKADDWAGLGYGYGYAYAQDRFCVAMAAIVFATSRSAEFLGEQRGDTTADFVLRYLLGTKDEFREQYLADPEDETLLLAEGFAAGMNRYLRETGVENLPGGDEGCRDADWVYEIDATDVWMHIARVQLSGSSDQGILRRAIFAPTGPDGSMPAGYSDAEWQELERALGRHAHPFGFGGDGSNALAVGRDFSQTGKGLLLGNPHLSWSGPSGFHQVHMTIPGDYDVAGAALHGVPWVGIGFNGDLAWTHTTSFASRFTLYELQLNPDDPLQYRYEDEWRDITSEDVTIQVRMDDGSLEERSHTFYSSHYGPIVSLTQVSNLLGGWPLPNGNLYSMRDANALRDTRAIDQYLDMGRARTVADFTEALKRIGIPVFHVFAADRDGEAFYGEIAGIPHVTQQQLDDCATQLGRLIAFGTNNAVLTLDGSSAACEWGEDPDSPPGTNLYGYEARPKLHTTDYVGNGNDSYWLTNADNPLTGFPVVFGWLGHENRQQSLRTRVGHLMVQERREATDGLDEAAGFTLESMKAFMYRNRVYGAEIVLDDVQAICADLPGANENEERAARACAVLADWDRKVDPRQPRRPGVHRVLARDTPGTGQRFQPANREPVFLDGGFRPRDPLNTPRGIDKARTGNRELVVDALSAAVLTLEEAGLALDAPWRDVQFAIRNGVRIPVHGGDPAAGVYGAISAGLNDGGYTPRSGNTYIQAVTWNDTCPIADVILAPSQSGDPESPHHADQTELYSRKEWVRFPYCEEEIEAAQIGETLTVEE